MPFSPDRIKQSLINRSVKLNPPATEKQIALLRSRVIGVVHPYLISMYQCFNGFDETDFDAKSFMEIWSIERVVSSEDALFKADYLPFADFLINAEIYLQSYLNPENPVIALFEGSEVASSTYEFWETFLSGELDVTYGK